MSKGADCVDLTSEGSECPASTGYVDATMGNLTAEDMLIIGAFVPAPETSAWLTLDLAVRELRQNGGLPVGGGVNRPVVAVACDGMAIDTAMSHLVDHLSVKGVVTSLDETQLSSALTLPSTRGATAMISTHGADFALASDGGEWLWSLGAPALSTASVYPGLVRAIEQGPMIRRTGGRLLRMVSLVSSAKEDEALADAATAMITLQGTTLSQLRREDRFRRYLLPDDLLEERVAALSEVVSYAPDIVLLFAGGNFADPLGEERASVVRSLEEAAAASLEWRPIYVAGPRNTDDSTLKVLSQESTSFRDRLLGLTSARSPEPELASAFAARFAASYPHAAGSSSHAPSPRVYDALYYMAYGLAAAPRAVAPFGVEDVRLGLLRVAQAEAEAVLSGPGPEGVERATQLLARNQPFNLLGITGPLAIGPSRAREPSVGAYCFGASYDQVGLKMQLLPDSEVSFEASTTSTVRRQCAGEAMP
jgi:hypothetical protein